MLIQLFWLCVVVFVPLALMTTRRPRWLLAWICLTTCVDVFRVLNFSATTFTGLLLLPGLIGVARNLFKTQPGQLALGHFGYLVFLGLFFGFLFPWPDDLGRPWSLQAPGRTVLYLARQLANLGLALFVAQQVVRAKSADRLLRYLLGFGLLAAIAGIAERLSGMSLYTLITEGALGPTYDNLRVRGFNFEPRGLGLTAAHCIFLSSLLWLRRRSSSILLVLVLVTSTAALILTRSVSGLFATAAGMAVLLMFDPRGRWLAIGLVALTVCVLIIPPVLYSGEGLAGWEAQLTERVGSTIRYGVATNWLEDLAFRMEIFDTAAVLFLIANPIYLVIGTGPALISIPATPFLPVSPYTEFYVTTGINSPPTMGGLLELANAGLIGLVLWITFFILALRAFNYLIKHDVVNRESWRINRTAFVGAMAMYLVAAGFLSSFWPLFVGMGLAVAYLRRIHWRSVVFPDRSINGN